MSDLAPFGHFAPSPSQARAIGFSRALDGGPFGKLAASLARRLVAPSLTGPLDLETWGLKLRLDSRANVAEKRVLYSPSRFDTQERAALAAALKPGDCFVDVGANVGTYALWAAKHVGPTGRVLALEPQPSVLERLTTNFALNPALPVTILPVAAGERDETLKLVLGHNNAGEASLARQADGQAYVEVPVRPLLDIVQDAGLNRINALKIDVEGFEESVLLPFFNTAPKRLWPTFMVLERGEEDWAGDLMGALISMGYAIRLTTRMNHVLDLKIA